MILIKSFSSLVFGRHVWSNPFTCIMSIVNCTPLPQCGVCHGQLGDATAGTDVRIRNGLLSCHECYIASRGETTCTHTHTHVVTRAPIELHYYSYFSITNTDGLINSYWTTAIYCKWWERTFNTFPFVCMQAEVSPPHYDDLCLNWTPPAPPPIVTWLDGEEFLSLLKCTNSSMV